MKKHRALWVIIIVIVVLAAAAAGVGIGLFESLPEAAGHVALRGRVDPGEDAPRYRLTKERYAMLYPALQEVFHKRA